MTDEDLILLLKQLDKHFWAINASYTEAAVRLGLPVGEWGRIKKALFLQVVDRMRVDGKIKRVTQLEWRGVLDWYKCPDKAKGPKKPTKGTALDRKQWDRLKQFFAEQRDLIESDGATMEFVIRLCRSNWLPANVNIVNEILALKKITLKGVC